jgi:4-carboxymuconolactone decarboxylase
MTEPHPALDAHPLPMLTVAQARAAAEAGGLPESLANPHVFRFALRHPILAKVFAGVIDLGVLHGELDARTREVVILRVGWRIGSIYEWSNHVPIAERAGMTEAEILAVRGDGTDPVLTARDRLAIDVVDEVLAHDVVSPQTLARARSIVGDGDELLELVALPGLYRTIGTVLATFSIPLESHVAGWAPDGQGPAAR